MHVGPCSALFFRFAELEGRLNPSEGLHGRAVKPVNDSRSFLNLDEILELPGELLGHIKAICLVLHIDESIRQNCIQGPLVEANSVSPHIEVLISTMAELNPTLIAIVELLSFVNIGRVHCPASAVFRLDNDLFSVWLQPHVGDLFVVAAEKGPVLLEEQVVEEQGGAEE